VYSRNVLCLPGVCGCRAVRTAGVTHALPALEPRCRCVSDNNVAVSTGHNSNQTRVYLSVHRGCGEACEPLGRLGGVNYNDWRCISCSRTGCCVSHVTVSQRCWSTCSSGCGPWAMHRGTARWSQRSKICRRHLFASDSICSGLSCRPILTCVCGAISPNERDELGIAYGVQSWS
jgi:hypothetical protein